MSSLALRHVVFCEVMHRGTQIGLVAHCLRPSNCWRLHVAPIGELTLQFKVGMQYCDRHQTLG